MTPDMLIVLAVGLGAVVLFATEKAPVDLVGLGVMVAREKYGGCLSVKGTVKEADNRCAKA